jgi:hypothetical protein
MEPYKVRHKSEGIVAPGCWDKDSVLEYAVFGPFAGFAYGHVVACFGDKKDADLFAAIKNFSAGK